MIHLSPTPPPTTLYGPFQPASNMVFPLFPFLNLSLITFLSSFPYFLCNILSVIISTSVCLFFLTPVSFPPFVLFSSLYSSSPAYFPLFSFLKRKKKWKGENSVLDPDPYIFDLPDPDPSIIKQKSKKNFDFYFFVTSLFIFVTSFIYL